jgi:hypothetical protein
MSRSIPEIPLINLRFSRFLLLTLLLCAGAESGFAQTELPSATFESKTELVLDNISALSEFYQADIKVLAFPSETQAQEFFSMKTNNLLSYSLDYPAGKVIIHLHLAYADASWTVKEWNTYINQILNN